MAPRKQVLPTVSSSCDKQKQHNLKNRDTKFISFNLHIKYATTCVLLLTIWFLVLFFAYPTNNNVVARSSIRPSSATSPTRAEFCRHENVSVYVYDLPEEFNVGLVRDCSHLNVYTDMCPHVANRGLGQRVSVARGGDDEHGSAVAGKSWFATHQFIGEMIFHARVENHPCRTKDPSRATLFYVPFYGGLHASSKFREMNITLRDELAVKLSAFLEQQRWWQRHNGKDHFLALGRTAWDFMRPTAASVDFGANSLLYLPLVKNMLVLTVERHPWEGRNQFGIPYPSYFHPSTSFEMVTWQNHVRRINRPNLFSFIGGPRKGLEKAAIRDELIKQCGASTRCELVKCGEGAGKCHNPIEVLEVMKRSEFCLQAPGDSFTRRSTFDAVLAGCVPVFFSEHTAYSQYTWFLPDARNSYSVYIDEKSEASKRIEQELMKIPRERIEGMRETVIRLIPRVTYVHPNATDSSRGFRDVVDVALSELSKHVRSQRLGEVLKISDV